jgi:antitoxin MazE
MTTIKTHMIKIGNSRGLRIPKFAIEQLKLGEEVEIEIQPTQLVIRSVHQVRQGWEDQFMVMAANGDDRLLDEEAVTLTSWDDEEWEWS